MATARDVLVEDLLQLFKTAYSERTQNGLIALLERFRIQAKSAVLSTRATARELLIEDLVRLWKFKPRIEIKEAILEIIGRYRMQLKHVRLHSESENGYLAKTKKSGCGIVKEPLAGGPQKRQRLRGECPKCHSMGVVLARSYSGDDYFSCIYCGYQAYRAEVDPGFNLPLAAELLNRRFDDKEQSQQDN